MSDEKRDKAIQADIDGRKEKLEKMRRFGATRKTPFQKRKFVRRSNVKRDEVNTLTFKDLKKEVDINGLQ